MSIFSSILSVARIAGQVLSQIPLTAEGNASNPPFAVKGIEAGIGTDGKPYIKNTSDGRMALTFVKPSTLSSPNSLAETVTVEKGGQFNPSRHFKDYKDGDTCAYDVPASSSDDSASSAISFSTALYLGASPTILGGPFQVWLSKEDTKFHLGIKKGASTVKISNISCSLTVLGGDNVTATAKADSQELSPSTDYIYDLPDSIDFSMGVRVVGNFTMPATIYESMVTAY
jgi:hypothetical protein